MGGRQRPKVQHIRQPVASHWVERQQCCPHPQGKLQAMINRKMHAGAGIPVQQLPGSRLVGSLVAVLEVATLAAFLYGMMPMLPDRMPESCLLVACMLAAPLLHYRSAMPLGQMLTMSLKFALDTSDDWGRLVAQAATCMGCVHQAVLQQLDLSEVVCVGRQATTQGA